MRVWARLKRTRTHRRPTALDLMVEGFGFRSFRVRGSRCRNWELGFRVQGLGIRVHNSWFMVEGLGSLIYGLGSRVKG